MIHKCVVDTKAGRLAFWDVQHTRTNAESMEPEEFDELWKADAWGGRVYFINTGSEGAWDVHLFVDEPIPEALLVYYKSLNRRALLRCPSGRIIVYGAEYYVANAEESPGSEDAFQIPAGDYELQLHELCEGDLDDPAYLEALVGQEDFAYFLRKNHGLHWGCAGITGGLLAGALTHWTLGAVMAAAGIGWTVLARWRHAHDSRYAEIEARIDQDRQQYPFFICTLRRIEGDLGLTGGWYNLTC